MKTPNPDDGLPTADDVRGIIPRSTPAQDATALAEQEAAAEIIYDCMRLACKGETPAWVPQGNAIFQDAARNVARKVLALRATSQAPDATKIATLEFELKAARYELEIADGEIDRLQALSTPSASAGPQAEADRGTLEESAQRLVDELLAQHIARDKFSIGIGAEELHAYVQLSRVNCRADVIGGWPVVWHFNVGPVKAYAHPQPQQADGRWAVIEEDELTKLITKARGKFINLGQEPIDGCSMERFIARELCAALQQSPASDLHQTIIEALAKSVLSHKRMFVSTGYKEGYFQCDHCGAKGRGDDHIITHKPKCPVLVAEAALQQSPATDGPAK